MKRKSLTILFIIFCASMLCFAGCGKNKTVALEAPLNLKYDSETNTLSWDEVEGCNGYYLSVGDNERTVQTTSISLNYVVDGGEYEVWLKALGDGERTTDSEFAQTDITLVDLFYISNNIYDASSIINGAISVNYGVNLYGRIEIPSVYQGITVLKVSDFPNQNEITEVILPDTVVEIWDKAFINCTKLERVVGKNVEILKEESFSGCTKLKTIETLKPVQTRSKTFKDCISFTGEGMTFTTMTEYVFAGCSSLSSVKILNSSVGTGVFSECKSLKDVQIEITEGRYSISKYAFKNCTELERIVLPKGIERISEGAFSGCLNLKEVVLPDTLEVICAAAFYHCKSLQSIVIPKKVRWIGGASSVSMGSLSASYGSAFALCYSLRSVTFADCDGWQISKDGEVADVAAEEFEDSEKIAKMLVNSDYTWKRDKEYTEN